MWHDQLFQGPTESKEMISVPFDGQSVIMALHGSQYIMFGSLAARIASSSYLLLFRCLLGDMPCCSFVALIVM